MRIKLDSTSTGLPEAVREGVRNEFLNLYDEFPVQVIWIYLKRTRFMTQGCTRIGISNTVEDYVLPAKHLHGLEDVIASCMCPSFLLLWLYKILISRTARSLFRKKDFCRVMHHASLNASVMAKPGWGLVSELTLDDDGIRRLQQEKHLVLGAQGKPSPMPHPLDEL